MLDLDSSKVMGAEIVTAPSTELWQTARRGRVAESAEPAGERPARAAGAAEDEEDSAGAALFSCSQVRAQGAAWPRQRQEEGLDRHGVSLSLDRDFAGQNLLESEIEISTRRLSATGDCRSRPRSR